MEPIQVVVELVVPGPPLIVLPNAALALGLRLVCRRRRRRIRQERNDDPARVSQALFHAVSHLRNPFKGTFSRFFQSPWAAKKLTAMGIYHSLLQVPQVQASRHVALDLNDREDRAVTDAPDQAHLLPSAELLVPVHELLVPLAARLAISESKLNTITGRPFHVL